MKIMLKLSIVFILAISGGTLLAAPSNGDSNIVEKAVSALDVVMADPVNGIPLSLITESEGIVIFPGACKIAAGPFNGPGGKGIAMIHNEDGSWSDPFIVLLREGSLGFQIGSQSSDIVLIFKDKNDVIEITKAEITLGGDVGIAAGPVNNGSSSGTDLSFEKEIYSYRLSEGLFAGVSLNGGVVSYYEQLSNSFYGMNDLQDAYSDL